MDFEKFNRFTLEDEPDEINEDDLVPTLTEFAKIHDQNKAVVDELEDECEELETQYDDTKDELDEVESELTSFKETVAEAGAESDDVALNKDELMGYDLSRMCELVGFTLGEGAADGGPGSRFTEDNRSDAGQLEDETPDDEDWQYEDEALSNVSGIIVPEDD